MNSIKSARTSLCRHVINKKIRTLNSISEPHQDFIQSFEPEEALASIHSIYSNPYIRILRFCKNKSRIQRVHVALIVNGEVGLRLYQERLVSAYGMIGQVKSARKVFDEMPDPDFVICKGGEPETYHVAVSHEKKEEWLKAMEEEMRSLHQNHTYDLVKLPKGKRALKNKWVFRLKTDENSTQLRYKARLVVKGFGQKKGVDFEEIFSLMVKMSSIRVVLGLASKLNLEVEQLDVKTAFLHGNLEEEIYMEQPEGFKVPGKEDLVCGLRKSLYGLKQAPRQWYKKFYSFMETRGYRKTNSDHCVFVKRFSTFDLLIFWTDIS